MELVVLSIIDASMLPNDIASHLRIQCICHGGGGASETLLDTWHKLASDLWQDQSGMHGAVPE